LQKRIIHIELMKLPIMNGSQGKKTPNSSHLGKRGEGFKVVQIFTLSKAFGN
jgi:hypothetical protein